MTTTWTRNAGSVCSEGLRHLGVLPRGQTANPEDMQAALDALGAVLKELPLYGYVWPKLSADTALVWNSGTPDVVALPSDYYGYPVIRANGLPIQQIKNTDWLELQGRTQTYNGPVSGFYVGPDNVLHLWPAPTTNPVLTIQYQRIVNDATLPASVLDVPQWMLNALGWAVAYELLIDYGTTTARATQITQRWAEKKTLVLANAISDAPISFSVADERIEWSPENWQAPVPIPDGFDAGGEP